MEGAHIDNLWSSIVCCCNDCRFALAMTHDVNELVERLVDMLQRVFGKLPLLSRRENFAATTSEPSRPGWRVD
jgi:hypothetical protein